MSEENEAPKEPENLTVAEIQRALRCSRWTVARRIKAGELDAVKGPNRPGRVLITAESLARYMERNAVETQRS